MAEAPGLLREGFVQLVSPVDSAMLLPALVTALELPAIDPNGRQITYHLFHHDNELPENETLASSGVQDDDTITIVPEITLDHSLLRDADPAPGRYQTGCLLLGPERQQIINEITEAVESRLLVSIVSERQKSERNREETHSADPATARRYLGLKRLPSELKKERPWRTREDPFNEVWDAVQLQIQESPGLEAKTLFKWLQREYPGRFSDGQVRTLQRRIKLWRVTEGRGRRCTSARSTCQGDSAHRTSRT